MKNNSSKRKLLLILIPILILALVCCITFIIVGLVFSFTTLPIFQGTQSSTNSSATVTPEVQFLQMTPAAKKNNNIFIRSVVPDSQSGITEVQLVLPTSLVKTDILRITKQIKTNISDNRIIKVVFSPESAPKSVLFTFKSKDQLLASCTINGTKILSPVGDCSW